MPVAEERRAYLEALALAPRDAEAALQACDQVRDVALHGDCQTQAVIKGRLDCDRVHDAMWREECWFQAADEARQRGAFDAGIAACERSGRFRDNCLFHYWQHDVMRVIQGIDWRAARKAPPQDDRAPTAPKHSQDDLVAATADATPIYEEWQARLGADWRGDGLLMHALPAPEGSPFSDVFWGRFYVDLLEHTPVLDLAACDTLAEAKVCRAAMVNVALRRMRDQRQCTARDAAGWREAVALAADPDPAFVQRLNRACDPY